MRKETTAALFVALLLLSTSVATVSAPLDPTGPNLPSDVEPYFVTIDSVYMKSWRAKNATYKGLSVINLTAGYIEVTNVTMSVFNQSIVWMNGTDMTLYATKIRIAEVIITPQDVDTEEEQDELRETLGDPANITYVEVDMIAVEMLHVTISGFESHTCPKNVTATSESIEMSGWDIEGATCCGKNVTKITAEKFTVEDLLMNVTHVTGGYNYTIWGPAINVENIEIYATYVKGKAEGVIPLEWEGNEVPLIVTLGKMVFGSETVTVTDNTHRVVRILAGNVTMSTLEVDISVSA